LAPINNYQNYFTGTISVGEKNSSFIYDTAFFNHSLHLDEVDFSLAIFYQFQKVKKQSGN
jgi:hypothetical protein